MVWSRMGRLAGLVMMMGLVLVACGVSTTPQGGEAVATVRSGGASGTQVVIRWRTRPSDAAEQKVYEELNGLANAQLAGKGIQVVYDPGVNQGYFEKLKTELASSNAPDIFWVGGVELADFVATGQVLDIKPFIDQDGSFRLDEFYAQPINELTRDGKVYGLPRDISTMVTYYNADLFRAANLPTPRELAAQGRWNWDTLLESARKLTDPAKQQYGLGFGDWWGPSWGYFVHAAGGGVFNKERTACALNTPESLAGAQFVQDLYAKRLVPLGDAEGEALFNAGKVGMYFNGRWFTPGVRTNARFSWDVAEMPMGKVKSTWLFWGPYLVNAKTAHADAAWEVLKVLTSSEAMSRVAQLGTSIPARRNEEAVGAFLQSTPPENNQAFLAGAEYAVAEAPVWAGSWADFSIIVQRQWDEMVAGRLTAEDFSAQVCGLAIGTFKQ